MQLSAGNYSIVDHNSFSSKAVNEVKWSHDGCYLALASMDKTVKIAQLNSTSGEVIINKASLSIYFFWL